MASPNDKRTHWFEERTPFDQRKRYCNGSVTGTFVTDNTPDSKRQVDCTACVKKMEKEAILS